MQVCRPVAPIVGLPLCAGPGKPDRTDGNAFPSPERMQSGCREMPHGNRPDALSGVFSSTGRTPEEFYGFFEEGASFGAKRSRIASSIMRMPFSVEIPRKKYIMIYLNASDIETLTES